MTTIRIEEFSDIAEISVGRKSDKENANAYLSIRTFSIMDGAMTGGAGTEISAEHARKIAKTLLEVADEVEKDQKE